MPINKSMHIMIIISILLIQGWMQPATAEIHTAKLVSPKIYCGGTHTLALMPDGKVVAWGNNSHGQLGDGTLKNSKTPVTIITGLSGTVKALTAGGRHSVALMSDGRLQVWGDNSSGQFGDGTTKSSSIPVVLSSLGGAIIAIAAGEEHTIALMADGTVKAWGANYRGQLGDGKISGSLIPVTVTGLSGRVMNITAGGYHSVAIMSDGTLNIWGYNKHGQLGDGTTKSSTIPVALSVFGGTVTAISAGIDHTVALMADGSVYVWGDNSLSQIGDEISISSSTPIMLTSRGIIATAIAAGGRHSVVLMENGNVKVYGDGWNSLQEDGVIPLTVIGLGGAVSAISAGGAHTVVIMSDGTVKAWGSNWGDQLGNSTNAIGFIKVPVTVTGLNGTAEKIRGVSP